MLDYRYMLMINGVSREKYDECMEWAFGEGWMGRRLYGVEKVFNKRHPECEEVFPSDFIDEMFGKVARGYLKATNQEAMDIEDMVEEKPVLVEEGEEDVY